MNIYRELLKDLPSAYVIKKLFDGDVEAAEETAHRIIMTHANPPRWCFEFHPPRKGWKTASERRVF